MTLQLQFFIRLFFVSILFLFFTFVFGIFVEFIFPFNFIFDSNFILFFFQFNPHSYFFFYFSIQLNPQIENLIPLINAFLTHLFWSFCVIFFPGFIFQYLFFGEFNFIWSYCYVFFYYWFCDYLKVFLWVYFGLTTNSWFLHAFLNIGFI